MKIKLDNSLGGIGGIISGKKKKIYIYIYIIYIY